MVTAKRLVPAGAIAHIEQTKQRGPPDHARAMAQQQIIQPSRLARQPGAALLGPAVIRQGRRADLQRRPRYRPGAQHFTQPGDHVGRAHGKTQPQPGKTPEFSETFQHHRARSRGQRDQAAGGGDIAETLVDHQQARIIRDITTPDPPVGIVRVDDNPRNRLPGPGLRGLDHFPAGMGKGRGMFVIADRPYLRDTRRGQQGDARNQRRCPGCGQDIDPGRDIPEPARRIDQRPCGVVVGQRTPVARLEHGQGIRAGIDAGRQIDPVPGPPAMAPPGRVHAAAMFARGSCAVAVDCRLSCHHALRFRSVQINRISHPIATPNRQRVLATGPQFALAPTARRP